MPMTHRQDIYYIKVAWRMSHILVMNMDASTSHIPYYVLRRRLLTAQWCYITDGEWKVNGQVHRYWMSLVRRNQTVGDICVWLIRWVIDDITKCVAHVESRTENICPRPRSLCVNSNKCPDNKAAILWLPPRPVSTHDRFFSILHTQSSLHLIRH